ncbi:MAG: serine/threonine-protein kinase, partial [Planctomycetota bacterium]
MLDDDQPTTDQTQDPPDARGSHAPGMDRSVHGQFIPGAKVADRYRIVSLVGRGGMGEVYRADDLKLGHPVALKFLPRNLADDPQRLELLHNEVRLTRQISHPNVCRVYDIGEVNGQHFLSMEYIDGEDLKILLKRIGRLPKDKGVEVAQQICAGLSAAHDRGILHRDLKPANIMIDGRGQVRVTDFGIATLAEGGDVGKAVGTPAYMAPEQLSRGETTIQSDLYSLGLILYELFTGAPVYKTGSIPELRRAHEESSLTKPSSVIDDMDPAVERVILRCLEPEPQHRPPSTLAVSAALPGGDPLAAALAAGETPSPELVANVRDTGSLQPSVAVAILISVIAAAAIWFAHRTGYTVLPDQPASVLEIRAADMLEDLGYADPPRNSVHGIMRHDTYLEHIGKPGPPDWSVLDKRQWPPPYVYWRRWSP